jgi:hypothetical protein
MEISVNQMKKLKLWLRLAKNDKNSISEIGGGVLAHECILYAPYLKCILDVYLRC